MITPDFRTYHPRSRIIAQGEDITLTLDSGELPELHDHRQNLVYYLPQPSFSVALRLLPDGKPIPLTALRNKQGQIVGFSLYQSAALVGLFTTSPDQRPLIPDTTQVLVTRQGLHVRSREHDDWQTLIWHPGL